MHVLLSLILLAVARGQVLLDTVGYTDRDRQFYGPALRFIVNDTMSGVHVVWKTGFGEIRYNYRPRRGAWRWSEGTVVNPYQRNLGCLDVDITRGRAYVSTDYLWQGSPRVSVFSDSARGAGRFRETNIDLRLRNCLVGATDYGYAKFAAVSADSLYYHSYLTWFRIGEVGPFPSHNLVAAKMTGRLGYVWTTNQGPNSGKLYLKQTPNNGQNWYETVCFSETVPTSFNRSLLGGSGCYDTIRIHVVMDLYDGVNPEHAQLWHYCSHDTPSYYLVHDYAVPAGTRLGQLNLAACRPSIGLDRRRREFYTVWEQFDPDNIDPVTGLCRADIWAARSTNNGRAWGTPVRLTAPDSTSKRFPFLADVVDETLRVLFFADRQAGVWEQGEGMATVNPVIYLRAPAAMLPVAVAEPELMAERAPHVSPSLSADWFEVSGPARRLSVLDATGRTILTTASARFGPELSPGVYFVRAAGGRCCRIVKTR